MLAIFHRWLCSVVTVFLSYNTDCHLFRLWKLFLCVSVRNKIGFALPLGCVPPLRLGIVLKRVVSSFHWPVCHYYLSLPADIQKNISFKHESMFTSVISEKLSGANATFQNHDCKERSRICWISVEVGVFIARSFQSISVEVNPEPNEAHTELLILIILWCLWHMQLWCSTSTFKSILFFWLYANSITVLA